MYMKNIIVGEFFSFLWLEKIGVKFSNSRIKNQINIVCLLIKLKGFFIFIEAKSFLHFVNNGKKRFRITNFIDNKLCKKEY